MNAEETKQYTASEFNEAIKQARRDGQKDGYKLGLRDGREEVKAALRELLDVEKRASAMD